MDISGVSNVNPAPSPGSVNSEEAKGQKQNQVNKLVGAKDHRGSNNEKLEELTEEKLEEGIETLNESVENLQKGLKFQIHEESDRMQVQVVDVIEDEVLKELPPEEVLEMLGKIREMVGLIIDETI
ncbi:flagellar protein FlaG [Natroniella sulfidigena]|uniref:flagellar protein FlaG n=1 Tax=Natroniella sulfidigena TaxID=723921 RepID=UPI002009EA45|nr:flagellar protein FlaG [Natroniella sulfidigena]MCK8816022.1 flagellar protein FlaG [Natroniella sulfidigena]